MERRCIGLDVHREFCQVAVWEAGRVRQAGQIKTTPEMLRIFADSLAPTDEVAIEATCNTHAIVRLLEQRVARVVVSNPLKTRAIAEAKIKTDKVDAATLAKLLAADFLPGVWIADDETQMLRRQVARRAHIVRQRTRLKNQVQSILHRNLVARCPAADMFGIKSAPIQVNAREHGQAMIEALEARLIVYDDELNQDDPARARDQLLKQHAENANRAKAIKATIDLREWQRSLPLAHRTSHRYRTWTRAEILGALQAWADRHGRPPRMCDIEQQREGCPSARTILVNFGTWYTVLDEAGLTSRNTDQTPAANLLSLRDEPTSAVVAIGHFKRTSRLTIQPIS